MNLISLDQTLKLADKVKDYSRIDKDSYIGFVNGIKVCVKAKPCFDNWLYEISAAFGSSELSRYDTAMVSKDRAVDNVHISSAYFGAQRKTIDAKLPDIEREEGMILVIKTLGE